MSQIEWTNWSGSVRCAPRQLATPASQEELCELVRRAAEDGLTIRTAGSGHSFTPLCASDGLMVSLDRMQGIESVDRDTLQATIRAGTKIHDLGEPLAAAGMALANQGDVDVQALAGAISTGTHGTGGSLGNLSSQVVGLRIVDSKGCVRDYGAGDLDGLAAARVSLGMLGIVTAVRLQLVPAYRLHERLWREPIEECLARLDERIAATRHYEFFWYQATDLAHSKSLQPTDAAPDPMPTRDDERIDHSFRVFPTVRENRFNEMEYALPAAAGPVCFREIRKLMRERHAEITWPVEYRTVAADDAWLSPCQGRETVTLSIHQGAQLPYERFFADAEVIFRRYDGRPHWGKIHSQVAEPLRAHYPRFDDFRALRSEVDPTGMFVNDYLRKVFEA
jgi:FAD/FMN-containing dehydrogenase